MSAKSDYLHENKHAMACLLAVMQMVQSVIRSGALGQLTHLYLVWNSIGGNEHICS